MPLDFRPTPANVVPYRRNSNYFCAPPQSLLLRNILQKVAGLGVQRAAELIDRSRREAAAAVMQVSIQELRRPAAPLRQCRLSLDPATPISATIACSRILTAILLFPLNMIHIGLSVKSYIATNLQKRA